MDVGPWAAEKLECLRKYLQAYTRILGNQQFRGYSYIDAFAGPGSLKLRQEAADRGQRLLLDVAEQAAHDAGEREYISGSPRVALEVEPLFTDYVFVELDKTRIRELEELTREFESRARVHVRRGDCNTYLHALLQRMEGQWELAGNRIP